MNIVRILWYLYEMAKSDIFQLAESWEYGEFQSHMFL